MAMGSGLLALALLAAEGPSGAPEDATTFQVRVLTLDGLEWRTSAYPRLRPVARQGTSTIWTADWDLAASLFDQSGSTSSFPKVTATGDALLTKAEAIDYTAAVDRLADGPINGSTSIAFLPRTERVEERFAMKVAGRKLDQGILARVSIDETHVNAVHGVPLSETLKPNPSKPTRTPAEVGREILNVVLDQSARECPQTITTWVKVPEISQARVEGEWLIPNGGVLLVSLGVNTVADPSGMAVVRERIAVIEATSTTTPAPSPTANADFGPFRPMAHARLPIPRSPARSMPESVDPDGNLVDLPPLPEALASADLDRIKPPSNRPSPQAPRVNEMVRDAELARTSYDNVEKSEDRPGESEGPAIEPRSRFFDRVLAALSNAGVDVEIRSNDPKATRPACDKCDDDEMSCPAGGMKAAPELSARLGVTLSGPAGQQAFTAVSTLDRALKTPGRTETTVIPLGGQVALEIKATVVPLAPEKAKDSEKKADAPTP